MTARLRSIRDQMENNIPRESFTSIIVPLFNEEDCILPFYHLLKESMDGLGEKYEIIFINDGSTDSSLERMKVLSKDDSNIRIIHFEHNLGQGKAIEEGFREAKGKVVVTIDGDLQNDPADIPRLLAQIHAGFDLVCGWRVKRGDTFFKKMKSKIGNFLQRIMTHLPLHDISCTLRAYRRQVVSDLHFNGPFDFSLLPFIITKKNKVKITEVKVKDNYRKFGKTKYKTLPTIVGTVRDYIRLVFSR